MQPTANPATEEPVSKDISAKTLGVGHLIGFLLLFNIPVVGWLVCIVMSFASKNRNVRNLARANIALILFIVILVYISIYVAERILEEYIINTHEEITDHTYRMFIIASNIRQLSISDMFEIISIAVYGR